MAAVGWAKTSLQLPCALCLWAFRGGVEAAVAGGVACAPSDGLGGPQDERCEGRASSSPPFEGLSLLSVRTHHERHVVREVDHGKEVWDEACVPLTGQGSYFTVDVAVGTPRQKLSVVADTGSNSLIIQSCLCGRLGNCDVKEGMHCFQGTGKSSTFSMMMWPMTERPLQLRISFGSGDVVGLVSRDVVRMGSLAARMDDGFLLMVDQALQIAGPTLEGILGLGIPTQRAKRRHSSSRDGSTSTPSARRPRAELMEQVSGFLEQAGVQRFAVCLSSSAKGVLRLHTQPQLLPLGSVGKQHWGLGLVGLSVKGNEGVSTDLAMSLCPRSSMKEGQETPCGAIPDSGSTGIFAPKTHLEVVKASLCQAWPRCRSLAAKEPPSLAPYVDLKLAEMLSHAVTFEKVIHDCASWLGNTSSSGEVEVPTLRLALQGAGGEEQTLEIPGRALFFSTLQEVLREESLDLGFFGKLPLGTVPTGEKRLVCESAFGTQDFNTELNGPVWILGLPLFYEHAVHYDLSAEPPSMAFVPLEQDPCRACGSEEGGGLGLADAGSGGGTSPTAWVPRPVGRHWRRPSPDARHLVL